MKYPKCIQFILWLSLLLLATACQAKANQNNQVDNTQPSATPSPSLTATVVPPPTQTPEPTASPTQMADFVPRHMLLAAPYFSIIVQDTQCLYETDNWNQHSAYMAYSCPELNLLSLSVRFTSLEIGQTVEDIFGKMPLEGYSSLLPVDAFNNFDHFYLLGKEADGLYDYFMVHETENYLISIQTVSSQDPTTSLDQYYDNHVEGIFAEVLGKMVEKVAFIEAPPTPTPLASGPQQLYNFVQPWLVSQSEASQFYKAAPDMMGYPYDGSWLVVGDNVIEEREAVCREFKDWSNADAPLVSFYNCVYYVGFGYDLEKILLDRPYAIPLNSGQNYPPLHLIYAFDNGPYRSLTTFTLQDEFLFYTSLSSRSLASQSTVEIFTPYNDAFLFNILKTNLSQYHEAKSSAPTENEAFEGDYISTDPGDGSQQHLSLYAYNEQYLITYRDEVASSCGLSPAGTPIEAYGIGLSNRNGNEFSGEMTIYCLSNPPTIIATFNTQYNYKPDENVIEDSATIWSRP